MSSTLPDLTFLILLFYYERPKLVLNLIESIRQQTYKNYLVAFIDDSEYDPRVQGAGEKLFYDQGLGDDRRWNYCTTRDTQEAKLLRGGAKFGEVANEMMYSQHADVALMACDDDCITPWYLEELNTFYKANAEIIYSYCDVITYDPSLDNWKEKLKEPATDHFLNHNHNPHNLGNSKDSSQVSWRIAPIKEKGVSFPNVKTACLDYDFYSQLAQQHGLGYYNGVLGAVKGYWRGQLGSRGCTYGDFDVN